jgi:hypothetical protein
MPPPRLLGIARVAGIVEVKPRHLVKADDHIKPFALKA